MSSFKLNLSQLTSNSLEAIASELGKKRQLEPELELLPVKKIPKRVQEEKVKSKVSNRLIWNSIWIEANDEKDNNTLCDVCLGGSSV